MTLDAVIKNFYDDFDYISNISRQSYNKLNPYKLFEESGNIIFKCLAPGINKEDINIAFDKKKLLLKSTPDKGDKDFKTSFDDAISLYKTIDVENSFAELDMGILTVTMPINKSETKKKILFR